MVVCKILNLQPHNQQTTLLSYLLYVFILDHTRIESNVHIFSFKWKCFKLAMNLLWKNFCKNMKQKVFISAVGIFVERLFFIAYISFNFFQLLQIYFMILYFAVFFLFFCASNVVYFQVVFNKQWELVYSGVLLAGVYAWIS